MNKRKRVVLFLYKTKAGKSMFMIKRVVFAAMVGLAVGIVDAQTTMQYLKDPIPEDWADNSELFLSERPVDEAWWRVFDDPTLDSLIVIATQRNFSVETALARMEQARMNLYIERGNLFPTLALDGGWTRQQTSGNTGVQRSLTGVYNLGATMSWEVDLLGSIRSRIKAEQAGFRASEEEYEGVLLSLCAQVATTYFTLRQYQQDREVVVRNSESQRSVLAITESRYNSGLASKLDVAQARSVYYGTQAQVPEVEANISKAINSLSVLLGHFPQDMLVGVMQVRPLPEYIEPVGVDMPGALLRRRPDVRQAERQVEVQAALLGASKKDWLPKFFVNGSFGFSSSEIARLPKERSMTWEIAPSISWTLFNGGQRYNGVRQARFQLDEAIGQYNQTVLQAMQECSNAMATYRNAVKQIVAVRQAFYQSEQVLTLSLDLYKQGLAPFQNVLDAQRSMLQYEEGLVSAQAASLIALVQLFQALGGGF